MVLADLEEIAERRPGPGWLQQLAQVGLNNRRNCNTKYLLTLRSRCVDA